MTKSHVTVSASDHPTPKQMKEFYLQVESGRMTKERFQEVLRGTNIKPSVQQPCLFFADEEVESNFCYPEGYAVKPVVEQLLGLTKHFPELDARTALESSKNLPNLPAGAEGWFLAPRREKVAKTYYEAVEKVLNLIGKTCTLNKSCKGVFDPKYLRPSERTAVALQMLGEKQKGDFLFIPAQFGLTHRGRSTRRVRMVYAPHEFGLGSFITGCMILSHPERLVQLEQLHIACPGDEYSPGADGDFSYAPLFDFRDGRVGFLADWCDRASEFYGSASAFLSQ